VAAGRGGDQAGQHGGGQAREAAKLGRQPVGEVARPDDVGRGGRRWCMRQRRHVGEVAVVSGRSGGGDGG
jgi:hypothetical protein